MNPPTVFLQALAVADGAGFLARPGALLAQFPDPRRPHAATILAAGKPAELAHHPAAASARHIHLSTSILIPGLVNAHTHLDLTHIGPQPFEPDEPGSAEPGRREGGCGFIRWIDMVRTRREVEDHAIAASVRHGIALSLQAGTVAIGDIAGAPRARQSLAPLRALLDSPLIGVSYLEFFAIGRTTADRLVAAERALDDAAELTSTDDGIRLGLQPHAPNTVQLSSYRWAVAQAARRGLPLTTHLAETPEERQFIAHARGPQRELLEQLGVWEDGLLGEIGQGRHPVAHLADILAAAADRLGTEGAAGAGFTVAHVNDADDAAIEILARTRTRVVYCPRASTYFGVARHFGPHRYQDMLAAGIPVAIGTDSIVNLHPWLAASPGAGLSILDELRFLHQRDGTSAELLLRMATTNGAAALGLDPQLFRFAPPAPCAGIVAVDLGPSAAAAAADPLALLLASRAPPTLLPGEIFSHSSE